MLSKTNTHYQQSKIWHGIDSVLADDYAAQLKGGLGRFEVLEMSMFILVSWCLVSFYLSAVL